MGGKVIMLKINLALLVSLIFGFFVAQWVGAERWTDATEQLLHQLRQSQSSPLVTEYFEAKELAGLPLPVQRFFETVLNPGQEMITGVHIAHTGEFNLSETDQQWRPFASSQIATVYRPGFVWDGHIQFPLNTRVYVHDAYIAGEGILRPSLLGLFNLAHLRGGGAIAEGELMRYLAEAAWYPTALLPSAGVQWTRVDDNSADATLTDGAVRVSLRFHFGADHLIQRVSGQRGRMLKGNIVMTAWEGQWSDYKMHNGLQIPMRGEVAWLTAHGRQVYWRGTVESLHHEYTGDGHQFVKMKASP
jgi:hypothetical protein